jgi:hypothetical protein
MDSLQQNDFFDELLHSISLTAVILMILGAVTMETFYHKTFSKKVGITIIVLLTIAFLIKVAFFPYIRCT